MKKILYLNLTFLLFFSLNISANEDTKLINNDNKVLKKYIGPLNDEDVYEIKKITKN